MCINFKPNDCSWVVIILLVGKRSVRNVDYIKTHNKRQEGNNWKGKMRGQGRDHIRSPDSCHLHLTFCSRTSMSFLSFVIIMFFLRIISSNSAILCYKGFRLIEVKHLMRTKWKRRQLELTLEPATSDEWSNVLSSFMVASFSSQSLLRL